MRLLLLLDRVAAPEELVRSSFDSTSIAALAAEHDIVVSVDEDSPALGGLRNLGIAVHASDKRYVHLPDDRFVDADTALATWIAARHQQSPFDLVVASPDRPLVGPVREVTGDAVWGVAAATGPGPHLRALCLDTRSTSSVGHELWRLASNVAAADLVVSPVHPRALGLRSRAPVVAVGEPPQPKLVDRARGPVVVAVGTGVSSGDAPEVMGQIVRSVDMEPDTLLVVLYAAEPEGPDGIADAFSQAVPEHLEQQVVLVPAERHGAPGLWLATCDAIVLAESSDLLVPEVARRSELVPTVVIRPDESAIVRRTLREGLAPRSRSHETMLVRWTSPRQAADELRSLRRGDGPTSVVFHTEDSEHVAIDWRKSEGLAAFDVVIAGRAHPPWNMPTARHLDGTLVGLHRRMWSVAADEIERLGSLPQLIARLADLAGASAFTLAIAAGDDDRDRVSPARSRRPFPLAGGPLPDVRWLPSSAADSPTTAVVPRARGRTPAPEEPALAAGRATPATPRRDRTDTSTAGGASPQTERPGVPVSVEQWAKGARWSHRALLAVPWRLGLARAVREGRFPPAVADWAKARRIHLRSRLLLPWRYGLLRRAMKDSW